MSNQNVPALRLNGFDGEWGNSTFADLIERSTLLSTEPSLPRVEYEDLVSGAGVLNKDLRFKDSAKTGIRFRPGDVLYGKLRPYLKNWLLADFDGLAVGDFWVLRPKRIDSRLLYVLIQTNAFSSIADASSGSKMPRADWKLVSSTSFLTPPTLEEQQAIGAIFTNLDAAINQHTLKHKSLQQTKTALMQRMFPQEGQTVPELRLEGFSGEWETTSIGAVSALHNGRDYKHLGEGCIPVYGTGGYMASVDQALSHDKDAVGIGRKGTINKPYILRAPFWTVDTLFYVVPNQDTDLAFFYASVLQVDWMAKNTATGLPSLTSQAINSADISVPPTLEEQQAIGAIFTKLDQLIAAEAQYIESFKQAKTALLQRMFI